MRCVKIFASFELFVSDLGQSVRFYERVLGFTVKHASKTKPNYYVTIVNGSVRIGLAAFELLPEQHYFCESPAGRRGVGVEIVLEVDDLAGYARRALLANAIFEPLQSRPWGLQDFRVVDPDGYYIRVTRPTLG